VAQGLSPEFKSQYWEKKSSTTPEAKTQKTRKKQNGSLKPQHISNYMKNQLSQVKQGKRGEMTQTLYVHITKRKQKVKQILENGEGFWVTETE
jgi:hypothetical protein